MKNPDSRVETDLLERNTAFAGLMSRVLGSPSESVANVEHRAQTILGDYDSIVWEGDPESFRFTHVSASAEQVLGFPCSRWFEPGFWTDVIVHPEDRSAAVAYCALATGRGQDHDFRYRARAADGRIVLLHDIVHVIKGRRGVAVRLRGVMVDVTATEGA